MRNDNKSQFKINLFTSELFFQNNGVFKQFHILFIQHTFIRIIILKLNYQLHLPINDFRFVSLLLYKENFINLQHICIRIAIGTCFNLQFTEQNWQQTYSNIQYCLWDKSFKCNRQQHMMFPIILFHLVLLSN